MRGDGHSVLVVDDEASIRLLCRVNLELEGYRVLEADTAAIARERLREDPVDVVLLDVHLGLDDGRELLSEIRVDWPTLPVALFSGTADLDTVASEGADGIIRKPFALEELTTTVEQLSRGRLEPLP